ncbi:hypothetical protein F5Y14DRAFT_416525 [Nemania sp. NC0429]|nr:hypothetical protein F5Y14DRAFT_416525 [Nemania sp. NC0429]
MSDSPEPLTTARDLGARVVYEICLNDIGAEHIVDISPLATEGCIRMIDCVAFASDDTLRIWEFPEPPLHEYSGFTSWPPFKYSTISYVWKGNPPITTVGDHRGYLKVKGAEDADPISIELLRCTCVASLQEDEIGRYRMLSRAEYLWLDRLCIVQTSKADKQFQIRHMFEVYRCCTQCLVLPGGLQRLVPLEEETTWATRAWTLQECLAPHYPAVLFPWTLGTGKLLGTSAFRLRELGNGTGCALARFIDVLRSCVDQPMNFTACPMDSKLVEWDGDKIVRNGIDIDIKIFGKGHADLYALRRARLRFQNYAEAFKLTSRTCYSVVWHCALMRTSSRPVDMVFSIMGLMGVNLNPRDFDANDRLGATIALASEIMKQGGSADWLGMPVKIPPCPELSTFPAFAKTEVSGEAHLVVAGKQCLMRELDEWTFGPTSWSWPEKPELWSWERLHGKMDRDGYLTFTRKACAISSLIAKETKIDEVLQWPTMKSTDGSTWLFMEDIDLNSTREQRTAAVPLWKFTEMKMVTENEMDEPSLSEPIIKLMLIREHAPGLFDLISYFYIHMPREDKKTWISRIEAWKEYDLKVGGPGTYSSIPQKS